MASERKLIDLNDVFPNGMMPVVTGDPWLTLKKLVDRISNAPIIDAVEVVHGRWEYIPMSEEDWQCTNCKEVFLIPPGCHPAADCGMHYCPNCGAKMDGDSNG